jgi:hypothetical protein
MAVRLSASRSAFPLLLGRILTHISLRGRVEPRAILRLESLGQLKNPTTSSEIENTIFRLAAQCLNQLRYRLPLSFLQIVHSGSGHIQPPIQWVTGHISPVVKRLGRDAGHSPPPSHEVKNT